MTDSTQELDEIAQLLGFYIEELDVDGFMPVNINKRTLGNILDWHNKQIEEVLDRLISEQETEAKAIDGEVVTYVLLSDIEAERNKLKESKR